MTFFLAKLSTHEATLFADWVLERSYVLSIETDSGRDPHTIFLTMNDRGQRLTDDEKLKAYLLSALPSGADRSAYSDRWQRLMDKLDSFANDDYDSHNYVSSSKHWSHGSAHSMQLATQAHEVTSLKLAASPIDGYVPMLNI